MCFSCEWHVNDTCSLIVNRSDPWAYMSMNEFSQMINVAPKHTNKQQWILEIAKYCYVPENSSVITMKIPQLEKHCVTETFCHLKETHMLFPLLNYNLVNKKISTSFHICCVSNALVKLQNRAWVTGEKCIQSYSARRIIKIIIKKNSNLAIFIMTISVLVS